MEISVIASLLGMRKCARCITHFILTAILTLISHERQLKPREIKFSKAKELVSKLELQVSVVTKLGFFLFFTGTC